jgi:hypothetical protein
VLVHQLSINKQPVSGGNFVLCTVKPIAGDKEQNWGIATLNLL